MAEWTAPQGLAVRASGEVIVADEAGLFEVIPVTGVQRRFSDPIASKQSIQVVVDGSGDAVVLGFDELLTVPWNGGFGIETPASLLALPVDAILSLMRGDSLARESDGKLLVSAFGFFGEGIFRIDPSMAPPTYEQVSPVGATDRFEDLALESDGTILGVGERIVAGEVGVFRVVPNGASMGTTTALTIDPAWTSPVAVAVAANGDVFVGDEGTCVDGACTGASVVRVDPGTGARLDVWSGGSITGPMDLAFVTALPACQDGLENDGDGQTDFPADVDCHAPWDATEEPDCADGIDNDSDGSADFGADAGCDAAGSKIENPQCDDGIDNDLDGLVDLLDPQCADATGNRERAKKTGCGLSGAEALPFLGLLAWRRRRAA
jgi:hypothetical protein